MGPFTILFSFFVWSLTVGGYGQVADTSQIPGKVQKKLSDGKEEHGKCESLMWMCLGHGWNMWQCNFVFVCNMFELWKDISYQSMLRVCFQDTIKSMYNQINHTRWVIYVVFDIVKMSLINPMRFSIKTHIS